MTEAPELMDWIEQVIEGIAREYMIMIEEVLSPLRWYQDLVTSQLGLDPSMIGVSGFLVIYWIIPTVIIAMAGYPIFVAYLSLEERVLVEDGDADR